MRCNNIVPNRAAVDKAPAALVACDICLTEIPASGALSEETSDYVAHFCGPECYEKWHELRPGDQDHES